MPRGHDDEGTRRAPQPCRDPGVPSGDRVAGPCGDHRESQWEKHLPDREAESARLEMEQIEMARVDLAPIDLAALTADDELIDALAAGLLSADDLVPEPIGPDDELVAMLAAWVTDVKSATVAPDPDPESRRTPTAEAPRDTAPEHALPTAAVPTAAVPSAALPTAVRPSTVTQQWPRRVRAVVAAGARGRHRARHSPYGTRMAAAAALVVMASSGVLISAKDAHPGEALWTVSKVFYGERARSVEAAAMTGDALQAAHIALGEGRVDDAAKAMAVAAAQLPLVRPDEGHDQLAAEHEQLAADLASMSAGQVVLTPQIDPTTDHRTAFPGSSLPLAASPVVTAAPTVVPPAAATATPAPVASTDSALAASADGSTGASATTTGSEPATQPVAQAVAESTTDTVAGAVEAAASAAVELGTSPANHLHVPARINSVQTEPTDTAPTDTAPTETAPTETAPTETATPAPTEPPVDSTDSAPVTSSSTTTGSTEQPADPDPTPPTTQLDAVPPPVVNAVPADTGAVAPAAETVQLPAVVPAAESPTVQLAAVSTPTTPETPTTDSTAADTTAGAGRHAAPEPAGGSDGTAATDAGPVDDTPGRHAAPDDQPA